MAVADPTDAPITVEMVMRPPATTVETAAHLAAAAYLMKHAGDTALVVTTNEDNRKPIGMITEADISHAVADGRDLAQTRISQLMIRELVTVDVDTPLLDATRLMLESGIRHLPVVRAGRLVGLVDMVDLSRAMLEHDST
jgi:CBS domain-containing protein